MFIKSGVNALFIRHAFTYICMHLYKICIYIRQVHNTEIQAEMIYNACTL